jgi:hypothetical protein
MFRGRVIRHVDDHIDFYDDKFVYTFLPENRRLRDWSNTSFFNNDECFYFSTGLFSVFTSCQIYA